MNRTLLAFVYLQAALTNPPPPPHTDTDTKTLNCAWLSQASSCHLLDSEGCNRVLSFSPFPMSRNFTKNPKEHGTCSADMDASLLGSRYPLNSYDLPPTPNRQKNLATLDTFNLE